MVKRWSFETRAAFILDRGPWSDKHIYILCASSGRYVHSPQLGFLIMRSSFVALAFVGWITTFVWAAKPYNPNESTGPRPRPQPNIVRPKPDLLHRPSKYSKPIKAEKDPWFFTEDDFVCVDHTSSSRTIPVCCESYGYAFDAMMKCIRCTLLSELPYDHIAIWPYDVVSWFFF